MPSPDDKLTIIEAATLPDVGVHPVTLSKATRQGEIGFEWRAGRKLLRRGDVLSWAARRSRRPGFVPAVAEGAAPRGAA